jgi:serine/threonine protein kinase/WD40 repeat protein
MSNLPEMPIRDSTGAPEPARRLWDLWRQGAGPDLAEYLGRVGRLAPLDLAAVVCVDLRERWRRQERPAAEDYLNAFPDVREDREAALDVVYCEFLVCDALGQSPAAADYAARFPALEPELGRQIQVHGALAGAVASGVASISVDGNALPTDIRSGGPELPGYELIGKLGQGGMAVVYAARQTRMDRRIVALKMLRPGTDESPEALARFRVEVAAVARLRHPNIVPIHEAGEHDGRPYFVMELVEGGSLARTLNDEPWSAPDAAAFVELLARAVHYSHQQGVLHRDLTPGNILMTADGTPKLSDFGLAKLLGAGPTLTQSGTALGTPSYMAPEQTGHGSRTAGPAVDIYGLGAILYRLLTGRPPFLAANALDTLMLIASEQPVSVRRLQPKVSVDLDTICLKCLQKLPAQRYGSAEELAADLKRFLERRPILARPVGPLERTWHWGRRNPGWASTLGTTAALLVLIAAGASLWSLSLRRALDQARTQQHRAEKAEGTVNQALERSYLEQALARRTSRTQGQRFEGLAAIDKALGLPIPDRSLPELRNAAIACLVLPDLQVLRQWDALWSWGSSVALDARLDRFAWGDSEGNIHIRRAGDDRDLSHLPGVGRILDHLKLRFSPDGRFLAVAYAFDEVSSQVAVWDCADPRQVRKITLGDNRDILCFSADSRRLVLGGRDGPIVLYDLDTRGEQHVGRHLTARLGEFCTLGRQLAFTSPDRTDVRLLDLTTGEVRDFFPPAPTFISALACDRQGRFLAVGCGDRNVYVWDMVEHRLQAVLGGHQRPVSALAFHPGGEVLATGSGDGTTRLWDAISGRQLLLAPGICLSFSGDGRRLAFHVGEQIGIWEFAEGRECLRLHHGRVGNQTRWSGMRGAESGAFSPDGRLAALGGEDGVHLWDCSDGRELGYLRIGRQEAVVFHPGGTLLATYGRTGLQFWPIRRTHGTEEVIEIGPPRTVDVPVNESWFRACFSPGGERLAISDAAHERAIVLNPEAPAERVAIQGCPKIHTLTLSPGGRWLATGHFGSIREVKVWETSDGRLVRSLSGQHMDAPHAEVAFSSDGRWLAVGSHEDYQVWEVGSWSAGPVLPRDAREIASGPVSWAGDSSLLATARSHQHIRLWNATTRRELATLSPADLQFVTKLSLTPDGGRLMIMADDPVIDLWDLHRIRQQLRLRGLDWGPSDDLDSAVPPSRVSVIVIHRTQEAENLTITAARDCSPTIQDMVPWGRTHWSNGHQLLCPFKNPTGYVELEVDVPRPGHYALDIQFTRSPDSGRCEVSLDGVRIGTPINGFEERVANSGKITLGTVELHQGAHRLRFQAVGTATSSGGYHVGIDCLDLRPLSLRSPHDRSSGNSDPEGSSTPPDKPTSRP